MSGIASTQKNTISMGRKCFLCQNTRYRSKHCRLFRFPVRGTAMWNRWLTAMALSEEEIRPNEHPRVCQRHFEPKHFLTRQLSGMAVPVWNLKRMKRKELCTVEEYPSQVARIFDRQTDGAAKSSDISDENNTEHEVAEDVLSEQEELLPVFCPSTHETEEEEQSTETDATTTSTLAAFMCSIPQHEALEGLLSLERAHVERLVRMNAQQKQIIDEQRNILWQLGVECVTLRSDKQADDSD